MERDDDEDEKKQEGELRSKQLPLKWLEQQGFVMMRDEKGRD